MKVWHALVIVAGIAWLFPRHRFRIIVTLALLLAVGVGPGA